MKNKILGILVCMLLITTIAVFPTSSTHLKKIDEAENNVIVQALDVPGQGFCVEGNKIENAFSPVARPLDIDVQVTSSGYDEMHPSVNTDSMGNYLIAYEGTEDGVEQDIYVSVSTDNGSTWTETGYFDLSGTFETYPSFDYANDRFYGSFTPDPIDDQGGIHYVVIIPDVTNPNVWELWWWVYGTWNNCTDRESSEIASDYYDGINPWQFGVVASVHTGLDDGTYRCPVMNYADDANEGYAWYYFWYLDDCGNAACEIDRTTDLVYAVYDWYDSGDGYYDIVYMKDDYTNMWPDGPGGTLYEMDTAENVINPTVAADDDNVMILAETDNFGNQDIICYYSDDGGSTWYVNYVVDSGDDEISPDIVSTGGLNAVATFIKNGDLYTTSTDNGGATWSTPEQVNDVNGEVTEEYRANSNCEFGAAWMDNRNGNSDIYFDLMGNIAPDAPTIDGPTNGKVGTEYTYTLNAVDVNGDDVRFHVYWGDGGSEITSYTASGTDLTVSYTWASAKTFTMRVQAQDTDGLLGPETTLEITIPRNRALDTPFLRFLQQHPNWFPIIRYLLGL